MKVETLQTLSTVFYTLSGVLFVTAIVLFFSLGIPKAFGIYTGLSAVRGIKKYQDKIQKESTINQTGKVNMTSPVSENLDSPQTNKINIPASEIENHTVILNDKGIIPEEPALPVKNPNAVFTVLQELSFTNSTEIIE